MREASHMLRSGKVMALYNVTVSSDVSDWADALCR